MKNINFIPGTSLRMSRLFNDRTERSVCVAMDHGFGGAHPGMENPGETLDQIIAGQPDGVLITPGIARNFQDRFSGQHAPAMILSIDYVLFHGYPGSKVAVEEQGIVSSVETAVKLGADAIKVLMIFGREDPGMQARNFDTVGRFIDESHNWGLPVMVEPTTWGKRFDDPSKKDKLVLRDMARIAFEFGADIVKCDYPTQPEDFVEVAGSCPVPVLVLGGTKKENVEELLQEVLVLVQKGASGVTFGRNVWQHPNPPGFIRALRHVVHDQDIELAMKELA